MTSVVPEKSNVKGIKTFFEADGGRKVEMSELKALTREDREELGRLSWEAIEAEQNS